MSTTFGVKIPVDGFEDEVIEIAFRSNQIRFTNKLAKLLPDNLEVIALDNTNQGIFTIGDIKKQIIKESNEIHKNIQ